MLLAGSINMNSGVIYYFCCRYQLLALKKGRFNGSNLGKDFFLNAVN